MAKELPEVMFLKVDVDECEDIASEYNVSSMPTFVFLKKGEKVNISLVTYLLYVPLQQCGYSCVRTRF